MKYIRVTNPDISLHLMPWYIADDETEIEVGMRLNDRMTDEPDDTYVLLAEDKGYLKAMLIGVLDGENLLVWQFKKTKDMNTPRQMEKKMYDWARKKGAIRIVLGSKDKRLRRLYRRKYGFTQTKDAYTMERAL